jgi:nitroreductase
MSTSPTDPSFFEVALNQRAYRDLKTDPVPDALIEQILKAGTHAPSAVNKQPWHFVVVQDALVRQKITEGTSEAWHAYAKTRAEDPDDPLFKAAERWATDGLKRAPVIIVVCGDTRVMPVEEMGSSIFPAAQNILLAASALGLGSLMASLPIFAPDGAFARALDLPEHIRALATLPIGYPVKALGKPRRRPIVEVTSRDRFGQSW